MNSPFVVIVDQATPAQLEEIHTALKKVANGWWHNTANVWILLSESGHGSLRDIVTAAIRARGGIPKVLVLRLPTNAIDRHWAAIGLSNEATDWLWRSYYGQAPPAG